MGSAVSVDPSGNMTKVEWQVTSSLQGHIERQATPQHECFWTVVESYRTQVHRENTQSPERKRLRIEPTTFLLWDSNTTHSTSMPYTAKSMTILVSALINCHKIWWKINDIRFSMSLKLVIWGFWCTSSHIYPKPDVMFASTHKRNFSFTICFFCGITIFSF